MKPGAIIALGLIALGAALVLLPFVWLLSVSLKPHGEIFTTEVALLPLRPTLMNYWTALTEAGMKDAGLYRRLADEGGMSTMTQDDARQAFPGGTLGLFFESSSLLKRFEEGSEGNFELQVISTPVVASENVYFPTGGSAIVMLADDPEKQAAAWQYISFVTGPEGQKIIVETTGYAPANKMCSTMTATSAPINRPTRTPRWATLRSPRMPARGTPTRAQRASLSPT